MPFYIEVNDRNVLLVGGGEEATRRAIRLLRVGASVKVLSKQFSQELEQEAKGEHLELIKGDAKDGDLLKQLIAWCDLLIIATNDKDANDLAYRIGRRLKKLVNLTTDAEKTDVVVPFEAKVHGLRITVTSEGKSGFVVRDALNKIVELLKEDENLPLLLDSMYHLKKELKKITKDARKRIKVYKTVYQDPFFRELIHEGRLEESKKYAMDIALRRLQGEH
ncbi:MAG: bifunctional precorrin-2 dehydrogenase/sirohydrochlorin ferrochelatase [Nitrososphaeria archaeon]|nr:bifunctional precorrin-2 dehydrogenase/sirohydrochlorin ferrochelatase [Nitrososphaeria archaeon]NIQ33244.1 bifunctional precorrin-2 dehydrogenase/sirohydrochlorin ferrochelatase [Nitrososphaeria archaeon]